MLESAWIRKERSVTAYAPRRHPQLATLPGFLLILDSRRIALTHRLGFVFCRFSERCYQAESPLNGTRLLGLWSLPMVPEGARDEESLI